MYDGKNPKALLSLTLLTNGLMELMKKYSYENISIKDICDKSGVSRQTFYNVIETKDELLKRSIRSIFDEIIRKQTQCTELDANLSIAIFVDAFYKNKSLVDILLKNNLEMIFVQIFIGSITELSMLFEIKEVVSHVDYHRAFYAGGISQILFYWMKDKNRVSENALIEILTDLNLPYFDRGR